MRHYPLIALALLSSPICAPNASASEISGIATLTSEYIYRGLARSDGNPAAQLGLDYENDAGFFAGAWASTVDLSSAMGQRDFELDYYAGYHYESQAHYSATVTFLRYTYPGHTGDHSYDHNEILVGVTWLEHYSIELGYTNDLFGLNRTAKHWELQVEWPVADVWVMGAALGGNDMSNAGVSHYLHWNVGASARFSHLIVDLRWFDNEKPDGFAARVSANSQFVLSISAAF